jgi:membrane fusion protein (multidrug efflux system)
VRVESNINNSQAETTVARIDPVLDASTRLLTIEAEVSNARGALRPGSFIRVALVLSVSEHAVIVPVEAVVQTLTGTYVYAVRDGIAHRVTVQVGEKRDGFAEVLDGLSAGVQVVIEGQFKLEDGAAVQVASGPAPNPPR